MKTRGFLKYFVVWLGITAGLILPVWSQTGRWVPFMVDTLGRGKPLFDAGDKCACYTKSNSRYFLLFDTDIGKWEVIPFDTNQYFKFVGTQGHVVLAWSDKILLGYSDIVKKVDTLHYEGEVLHVVDDPDYCSYGYGNNLAFFETDKKLYVFDSDVGNWVAYDLEVTPHPDNFSFVRSRVKDHYIAITFSGEEDRKSNVVYSAYTKTFAELEEGCLIQFDFDYGFAGRYTHDYYDKDFNFVGYSAKNNSFDVLHYTRNETNESYEFFSIEAVYSIDTLLNYVVFFDKIVEPLKHREIRIFAYSTRLGHWTQYFFDIYDEEEKIFNYLAGGRFAVLVAHTNDEVKRLSYIFFNALTGSIGRLTSDMRYRTNMFLSRAGGVVYMASDGKYVWGYNPLTGTGSSIDPVYSEYTPSGTGEDFAKFFNWTDGSAEMIIYFYNARTNRWTSVQVADHHELGGSITKYTYIYASNPEKEVVFYSSYLDTVFKIDFSQAGYLGSRNNDVFGIAYSDSRSLLINGLNGAVYEKGFKMYEAGLGDSIAAFWDRENRMLHGYSVQKDSWSEMELPRDVDWIYTGVNGNTCLMLGKVRSSNNKKVFAYNGNTGHWLELDPDGEDEGVAVGRNTAVVARSTHVYVYDPTRDSSFVFAWDLSGHVLTPEQDTVTAGRISIFHWNNDHTAADLYQQQMTGEHHYAFSGIPKGEITLYFDPDTVSYGHYLRTYLGNTPAWAGAAFFELEKDTAGLEIILVPKPDVLDGNCEVEGKFVTESGKSGSALVPGMYNGGGTSVGKVPVFLTDPQGNPVAYDVTAAGGEFVFHHLPAGHYGFLADYAGYYMSRGNDSLVIGEEDRKYYITAVAGGDSIRTEISNITGMDELNGLSQFTVYPNPAGDRLYVRFGKEITGEVVIRITAMDGTQIRVLRPGKIPADALIILPVSDLPPGIYMLSVEGRKIRSRSRFVKINR